MSEQPEKGEVNEKFQEIWSVHIDLTRWRKHMDKVSNFLFISPWLDAMKSIFIANLSTPQKNTRSRYKPASVAHGTNINHPIAPIQFKSENNTLRLQLGISLLRFGYQDYDTFLWCTNARKLFSMWNVWSPNLSLNF